MRLSVLTLLLLTAAASVSQAQSQSATQDVRTRSTISLDGTWNTIIDPYETGLQSH